MRFGRGKIRFPLSAGYVLLSLLCSPWPALSMTAEEGELVVVLLNVTSVMSPSIVGEFEQDITTFMTNHFQNETGWGGTLQDWRASLTSQTFWTLDAKKAAENSSNRREKQRRQEEKASKRQNRRLRSLVQQGVAPLVIRTSVTAMVSESLSTKTFVSLLQETVDIRAMEFLVQLKESESMVTKVYFDHVQALETFAPGDEITTTPADPIQEEAPKPADEEGSSSDDGDDGLSSQAIAGIAAAAGFVLVLIVGILCVSCRSNSDDDGKEKIYQAGGVGGSSMNDQQDRALVNTGNNDQGSMSSSGMSSRYRSRNLGPMRSTTTRIVSPDGRTISVDPNDSASSRKLGQPESAPLRQKSSLLGPEPVFEDEGENGVGGGGEREEEGGGRYEEGYEDVDQGDSMEPATQSHDGGSTQPDFSIGESVEKHQESQAGAMPTPLEAHQQQDQQQRDQQTPPQESGGGADFSNFSRQVVAPPGKLGIVIETTLEGPVVHKINEGSPLMNLVFEGELITAIDDVDTRAMSASAITNLMIRTADSHRTMTVRTSMAG